MRIKALIRTKVVVILTRPVICNLLKVFIIKVFPTLTAYLYAGLEQSRNRLNIKVPYPNSYYYNSMVLN